jgi:hypothetical protein
VHSPDSCRREENDLRLLLLEELGHTGLIAEVEVGSVPRQNSVK